MALAIAGTYRTFLLISPPGNYAAGPFVVIGNDGTGTVTVNGVAIKQPLIGASVSWNAADGNPSSANISFVVTSTWYACYGTYVEGSGPLPTSNNLFGNSQPPPQTLSSWNATYNTFVLNGQTWGNDSTLVVNDPQVTYNGAQLSNIVYTGIHASPGSAGPPPIQPNPDLDQLAWFTASGNAQNAIIYFGTDSKGYKTFGGTKWASGTEPAALNFSGSTAPTPPPPPVGPIMLVAVTAEVEVVAEVVQVEVAVNVANVNALNVNALNVNALNLNALSVGMFTEEVEKPPGEGGSPDDPKEDSKASSDLSSKANEISGKKNPE
jgi:hypothetical protein